MKKIKFIQQAKERDLTVAEQSVYLDRVLSSINAPDYHKDYLSIARDITQTISSLRIKQLIKHLGVIVGDEKEKGIAIQFDHSVDVYSNLPLKFSYTAARRTILHIIGIVLFEHVARDTSIVQPVISKYPASLVINIGNYSTTTSDKPIFLLLNEITSAGKIENCVFSVNDLDKAEHYYKSLEFLENRAGHNAFIIASLPRPKRTIIPRHVRVKHDNTPIIKTLNKLTSNAITECLDEPELLSLVYNFDLAQIYYSLLFYGVNAKTSELVEERTQLIKLTNERRANTILEFNSTIKNKIMNSIALERFKKNYFALSDKEKQTIVKAYDLQLRAIDYKHKDLLRKISNDDPIISKTAFDELKKVDPNYKDVLCEHMIAKIENKGKVLEEYGVSTNDYFYCRLCGEVLQEVVFPDVVDRMQNTGVMADRSPLDVIIWNYTTIILNNYIVFKYGINTDVVQNIVHVITPFINEVETKLYKVRTHTQAQSVDILHIYICIYVLVSVIKLMNKTNTISFRVKLKAKKNKKSSRFIHPSSNKNKPIIQPDDEGVKINNDINDIDAEEQKDASKLEAVIVGGKENIINYDNFGVAANIIAKHCSVEIQRSGISFQEIKRTLVNAYNTINVYYSPPDISNGAVYWLATDPLWLFATRMHNTTNITKILNMNTDELTNTTCLYCKASVLPGKSLKEQIYNLFIEYYNKIYRAQVYPQSDILTTYYAKWKTIYEIERVNMYKDILRTSINHDCVRIKNTIKFQPRDPNFGILYNENGGRVRWTGFIIEHAGKKQELTVAQISELIGTKMYKEMKIVDVRANNGVLKSKMSNDELMKKIKHKETIGAFFNYYQFKCPKPSYVLHEFKDDVCVNCRVSIKELELHDEKYYEKYKGEFKKDEESKIDDVYKTPARFVHHHAPSKYIPDNASIVKLSSLAGVPYNVLFNLGLSEGLIIEEIYDNKINPSDNNELNNTARLSRIANYHRMMVLWSLLLNNKIKTVLPFELETFMQKNSKFIPPLFKPMHIDYTIAPEVMSMMMLIDMCSQLVNVGHERGANRDYVLLIVNKILATDKFYAQYNKAKLKESNEKILENKQDAVQDADMIANVDTGDLDMDNDDLVGMDFDEDWEDNLEGKLDIAD